MSQAPALGSISDSGGIDEPRAQSVPVPRIEAPSTDRPAGGTDVIVPDRLPFAARADIDIALIADDIAIGPMAFSCASVRAT
jgi:hypothetical protein